MLECLTSRAFKQEDVPIASEELTASMRPTYLSTVSVLQLYLPGARRSTAQRSDVLVFDHDGVRPTAPGLKESVFAAAEQQCGAWSGVRFGGLVRLWMAGRCAVYR